MIDPATLLAGIPGALRDPLLSRYQEIARNYLHLRWEPAELNGGKFAEVAFSVVSGAISGAFPSGPSKPRDFAGACRALESLPAKSGLVGDRSLRVLIPRQLVALYEIRNNRGVGHVGGDVDPNAMDAATVHAQATWVLAELVRVFHGVGTAEAQAAVDALAERVVPLVWTVPGTAVRRVLEDALDASDQTLLLLHTGAGWMSVAQLACAIEYTGISKYRSRVLFPLHTKRLVEFDKGNDRVHITPKGATLAEDLQKG